MHPFRPESDSSLADETHPLSPEFDNRYLEATYFGFLVTQSTSRQINTTTRDGDDEAGITWTNV